MDHDVGVLLTKDVVGKTLYSHYAACQGKIVKLFITEVGYTHTSFETADGRTGSFCTGNQGKGARNWEAIDFELAQKKALCFWINKVAEMRGVLLESIKAIAIIKMMNPEVSESSQKMAMDQEEQLEYRYRVIEHGKIKVAINPVKDYCTEFYFVFGLQEALLKSIPFPFEISSKVEIHILGGDHRKGMVSVEVTIEHSFTDEYAISQLKEKHFHEGLEIILG